MQISKRNFLKPESSDPAIIENISDNFGIIENLMDAGLGATWGGYLESDSDLIESDRIYVDRRDNKQWLGISNGEFSKASKSPFSLNDKTDKSVEIIAGNGLVGGGDLSEKRTLNIVSANSGIAINSDNIELKPPTSSTIGGVKQGNGIIINPNDGVIQATVPVGGLIFLTQDTNPAELFWGTSWEKIQGRYLRGTSGNEKTGVIGGNKEIKLEVKHMPSHTHIASQGSHVHSQQEHYHLGIGEKETSSSWRPSGSPNQLGIGKSDWDNYAYLSTRSGGDNTGEAQPSVTVNHTGEGVSFNAEPPFYTVHIWKRII
ncbi:MAG: phage baseplate protein [Fusobacteriaceae bacterium]